MSDLIPGKRYRLTIDGVANEVGALSDGVQSPVNGHRYGRVIVGCDAVARAQVEVLPDPLPTTPQSAVLLLGRVWTRDSDGISPAGYHWRDVKGNTANDRDLKDATVLFDAGADQ